MKKFLALALTLTLALALSISVFADFVVGDRKENGSSSATGTYKDGESYAEFGSDNPNLDVDIKVTAGAYEHRYAVDVVYEDMSFEIAGANMVWDVNTLQYVVLEGQNFTPPTARKITITNYSDMPVYLGTNVVNKPGMDTAPMELIVSGSDSVAKATATDTTNGIAGSPSVETLTVTPTLKTDKTWNDVANHFAPYLTNQTEYIVATLTLTISKDDPQP